MTFKIDNDAQLKRRVRALTGYERDDDELSEPRLDDLVSIAKLSLYNETGSDGWYTDSGLGQALLGVTCIRAKESLENYSVSAWDIGDESIDVSGASDPDSAQFDQWNQMVRTGLEASSNGHSTNIRNTSSYIGE